MKEQIEEIAKVLKGMDRFDEAKFGFYESYAQAIYNAGYRKQKEGKWIEQARVTKEGEVLLRHYKCNLCGVYLATQANFCPNCGAKMKGGAE